MFSIIIKFSCLVLCALDRVYLNNSFERAVLQNSVQYSNMQQLMSVFFKVIKASVSVRHNFDRVNFVYLQRNIIPKKFYLLLWKVYSNISKILFP